MEKRLLKTLTQKDLNDKSVWLMRQAGRYLPEYRKVRSNFSDFIEFCMNSEAAAEVTIQPLKRFDLDAAIIFSDILVIPHALGIKVEFQKDHGPILDKVQSISDLNAKLKEPNRRVYENVGRSIALTKAEIKKVKPNTALIGFAGSPFTVASYMIEGKTSKDFRNVLRLAYEDTKFFNQLIDKVTDATIDYLMVQIENGAEVVKLFDSWSGVLNTPLFNKLTIKPTNKIVEAIKAKYPDLPVIGFARGAGVKQKLYAKKTKIDCVAIDQYTPLSWVLKNVPAKATQGNLDNMMLAYSSPKDIKKSVNKLLDATKDKAHIVNLGHGVIPETPVDNVKALVDAVREYKG